MLTQAHVRALRDNPSVAVRAEIAAAVAADFAGATLTATEMAIATQILRALAQDVERRVRQALAEHVKSSPSLPHEIALTLARDIEDAVALPILEHSPLLDDDDLIAAIALGVQARQLAIARRPVVGEAVADALVATGDGTVIGAVLANEGAEIADGTLLTVAIRHRGDGLIEALLVERAALPLAVCEILMASVSAALRDRLVSRHQLPEFLADELATLGRERAVAALAATSGAEAAARLAEHLHANGRLSATLVLRSLVGGDLTFFESAMATLAGVPLESARTLLYDRGVGGLRAIYARTALPPALFRACRAAITTILDGHLARGRAAFTRRIVDQLVILYDDMCPAELEPVLAQLARRHGREDATAVRGAA